MPSQGLSNSSSSSRTNEKKRKHVTSPRETKPGKEGARLQLDDILSFSEPKEKGSTIEKDAQARSMKKRKDVEDVRGKGGGMSALDLLLGGRAAELGEDGARRNKAESKVGSNTLVPVLLDKQDRKVGKQKDLNMPSPTQKIDSATVIRTSATDQSPAISSSTSSGPSRPHVDHLRTTKPTLDAPHTLKSLRTHLRVLISTLQALESESVLVDRMWYKNRAQFRSAFWWTAFDGVRRSLHRLLPPSASDAAEGQARVAVKGVVKDLVRVYAGLGGVQAAPVKGDAWPTLPKLDTRPTTQVIHSWLDSSGGSELLSTTLAEVQELQSLLRLISKRTQSGGRTLVTHLNTPPAPTFAVVVTAILGLTAGIHAEVNKLVCGAETTEGVARGKGVIEEIVGVLQSLR